MPVVRIYKIFIARTWPETREYSRVIDTLNRARMFDWSNCSGSRMANPQTSTPLELDNAFREQMQQAEVFIVPCEVYSADPKIVQKQINIAQQMDKPILAMKPLSGEHIPPAIHYSALEMLDWIPTLVASAIRIQAKQPTRS